MSQDEGRELAFNIDILAAAIIEVVELMKDDAWREIATPAARKRVASDLARLRRRHKHAVGKLHD